MEGRRIKKGKERKEEWTKVGTVDILVSFITTYLENISHHSSYEHPLNWCCYNFQSRSSLGRHVSTAGDA